MIQVLVVEDSLTVRELLVRILNADPDIHIAGTAADGAEAMTFLQRETPDVVTMDIHMPKMDGLEATRKIMETCPVPIVVVSGSWNPDEVATTFRAMEAGAVALVEKPRGLGHPEHAAMAAKLVRTVKAMAEVRVIRRWARSTPAVPPAPPSPVVRPHGRIELVGVGVSTGGPPVLQTILRRLPRDFPAPILIVQHIAAGFVDGLAEWLAQSTGWPVQVAAQGQMPRPGHAYLAPDGAHLCVGPGGRMTLNHDDMQHGLRPAASHLFRSVAAAYGAQAVGVLLTGMGKDGAEELKLMRDRGAVTIAQDHASSVVHGMPGEAIRLGGATYVLSPEQIADALVTLARREPKAEGTKAG